MNTHFFIFGVPAERERRLLFQTAAAGPEGTSQEPPTEAEKIMIAAQELKDLHEESIRARTESKTKTAGDQYEALKQQAKDKIKASIKTQHAEMMGKGMTSDAIFQELQDKLDKEYGLFLHRGVASKFDQTTHTWEVDLVPTPPALRGATPRSKDAFPTNGRVERVPNVKTLDEGTARLSSNREEQRLALAQRREQQYINQLIAPANPAERELLAKINGEFGKKVALLSPAEQASMSGVLKAYNTSPVARAFIDIMMHNVRQEDLPKVMAFMRRCGEDPVAGHHIGVLFVQRHYPNEIANVGISAADVQAAQKFLEQLTPEERQAVELHGQAFEATRKEFIAANGNGLGATISRGPAGTVAKPPDDASPAEKAKFLMDQGVAKFKQARTLGDKLAAGMQILGGFLAQLHGLKNPDEFYKPGQKTTPAAGLANESVSSVRAELERGKESLADRKKNKTKEKDTKNSELDAAREGLRSAKKNVVDAEDNLDNADRAFNNADADGKSKLEAERNAARTAVETANKNVVEAQKKVTALENENKKIADELKVLDQVEKAVDKDREDAAKALEAIKQRLHARDGMSKPTIIDGVVIDETASGAVKLQGGPIGAQNLRSAVQAALGKSADTSDETLGIDSKGNITDVKKFRGIMENIYKAPATQQADRPPGPPPDVAPVSPPPATDAKKNEVKSTIDNPSQATQTENNSNDLPPGDVEENTSVPEQKRVQGQAKLNDFLSETEQKLRMVVSREESTIRNAEQARQEGGWFGKFKTFLTRSDPYQLEIDNARQKISIAKRVLSALENVKTNKEPGKDTDPEVQAKADAIGAGRRTIATLNRVDTNDEKWQVEQEAITVTRDVAITAVVTAGTLGTGAAASAFGKGAQVAGTGLRGAMVEGAKAGAAMSAAESSVRNVEDARRGAKTIGEAIKDTTKDTAIGGAGGAVLGGAIQQVGQRGGQVVNRLRSGNARATNRVEAPKGPDPKMDELRQKFRQPGDKTEASDELLRARAKSAERAAREEREAAERAAREQRQNLQREMDQMHREIDELAKKGIVKLNPFDPPHKILGISPNASPQDVQRAARELLTKYHPDLNIADAVAEHNFKQVQNARDVLLGKRRQAA